MSMRKVKLELDRSVRKLLNEILAILDRDKKTIADLAREIDRSYHQTYAWLVVRRFHPSSVGLMILRNWRDQNVVTLDSSRSSKYSVLAGRK